MALDHFLCPGEVREIYGEKPTVLDIRFPMENIDDIFPQYYKLYGQSAGLKSYSDGITVWTRGDQPGEWITSPAPSKEDLAKQGYKAMGTLNFILPKVSRAGTYQITTRSFHSIVKLNSCIDYIKVLFGRVSLLPLKLILEPTEAHIVIKGVPSKKVVYTMKLHFEESEIMNYMRKRKEALAQFSSPIQITTKIASLPAAEEEYEEEQEIENASEPDLEDQRLIDSIPFE